MFEQLQMLLEFDPVLIGAFAGLSMMVTQMLKGSVPWVSKNPMVVNLVLSTGFATAVVYEQAEVLGIAILTFLIMSSASGVYSSTKSKTVVELPDYSDDV
jgi:hypothetical protein